MASHRCHRTDNARRRIYEIVGLFPKPLSNDVLLINAIRDISITLFGNCITLWTKNRANNQDADKRTKFVMPKSRDITVASCLICAVYSTNKMSFYPIFPLDVLRYSFAGNSTLDKAKAIEFEKFKKRVFEFVSIIQENELTEINHPNMRFIPTFDYGMLIARIAQHIVLLPVQESTIMSGLFEQIAQEVTFGGKSPVFICLLILYHIGCSCDCSCYEKVELNYKQQDRIKEIISQQLKNMRWSMDMLTDANEKLRNKHLDIRV